MDPSFDADTPQTTLFEWAAPRETHLVAAHTRILADGTSTFVAEHLRWNRGRSSAPRFAAPRIAPLVDPGQLGLFFDRPVMEVDLTARMGDAPEIP